MKIASWTRPKPEQCLAMRVAGTRECPIKWRLIPMGRGKGRIEYIRASDGQPAAAPWFDRLSVLKSAMMRGVSPQTQTAQS